MIISLRSCTLTRPDNMVLGLKNGTKIHEIEILLCILMIQKLI